MTRIGSRVVWAIALALCLLSLVLGATAAQGVVSEVGGRAPVGSIVRNTSYVVYYWSLATFLVMLCWLLLGARSGFALAAVPPSLGVLPEGLLSLLAFSPLDPATEASLVRIVEAVEAPGLFLSWIITGYRPDRFAAGLTDPPTRTTLLALSSIGYLNALFWLTAALGLHAVVSQARSRRKEG